MADYDGDIKLHVDLDNKSALQSLKDIAQAAKSAFSGNASSGLDKNVQATNRSLQQTQRELKKVQSEIEKTAHKRAEYEARYEAVGARGTRTPTKTNQYEYMGEYYTKSDAERLVVLGQQIENAYEKLNNLRSESAQLGSTLEGIRMSDDAAQTMERTEAAAEEATQHASGLKDALSRVGGVAASVGSTILKVFKGIGSAVVAPIQSLGSKITGIFGKIASSIKRVFVFSVITKGLRSLRLSISGIISSNASLSASLGQIQSSLWTAFAPIYSAALPAIQALINILATAISYIAAFFAALGSLGIGKAFGKAQSLRSAANSGKGGGGGGGSGGGGGGGTDEIDKEIKAINKKIKALEKEKKAYEKQKKAEEDANKRSLLSFDELNQIEAPEVEDEQLKAYEDEIEALQEQLELLQDRKDELSGGGGSGGGGGGGGAGIGALDYPTMADSLDVSGFVEELRKAWQNADFTTIGNIIGEKLESALDTANTWLVEKGQPMADKIGKSVATLLNGFFETEGLGTTLGKTIGNSINTVLSGVNAFIDNTHFRSIGNFIGDSIMGAVNTINWEGGGHLISGALNGLFDIIGGIADSWDGGETGRKIAAGINQAIRDFKWAENAQSLSNFVLDLADTLIELLSTVDWEKFGEGVGTFLAGIDWAGMWERVWNAVGAAAGAAAQIIYGIIKGMADKWADDIKKAMLEAVGNKAPTSMQEVAQMIVAGLKEGLHKFGNAMLWGPQGIMVHMVRQMIKTFKNLFGIHSPSTVMKEQGGYIIQGLIDGMKAKISGIVQVFVDIKDKVLEKVDELREKAVDTWENFKTDLDEKAEAIWTNLTTWWAIYRQMLKPL